MLFDLIYKERMQKEGDWKEKCQCHQWAVHLWVISYNPVIIFCIIQNVYKGHAAP